ncbi:MAG: hypothetical protein KDJ99_22140, partial [Candidatus Competibacteraceae bacterium]|nr:hypothetical protein [Candidatus Competibacteraceae bacterium]
EVQTIIAHYPLLNDKLYQRWQGDPAPIVEAMQQRLGGTQLREAMQHVKDHAPPPQKPAIHIPRLKKPFTDLDKDRFIKQAFAVIRDYFKEGLKQLDTAHPEIDVDFTEITSIKFVCKAYVNGDLKAQRRIWLGGITGSHEISFLDGEQSYDTDNHYNGWVSVADDGYDLFLTDTTLTFYGNSPDKLSPEEAAELLWKGFTDQLTW